jgi:fatty-acid O-methyltransferase
MAKTTDAPHIRFDAQSKRSGVVWPTVTHTDRVARTALWKLNRGFHRLMYTYLSRRADDDVIFLNCAYEQSPPMALPLDPGDEPHRYSIQLYHATATQNGALTGKQILEVGCGHGGGASYLTRTFRPASYVGLDLNAAGIEFCRRHHQLPGLEFIHGHAENLPFPSESFDAVINVESSHCYPHFDRFLSEVTRVLRPGGTFLYTDVRQWFQFGQWEAELNGAGMRIASERVINTEVLQGMELNAPEWEAVWDRYAPRFLRPVGKGPVRGGTLYRDIESGDRSYRMYCLAKV